MPDREKITMLLERTPKLFVLNGEYEAAAEYLVENGVAVVVRCKDCINGELQDNGAVLCRRHLFGCLKPPTHFCSYGERK